MHKFSLFILVFSPLIYAAEFNFWESSANNSALASANGARAEDASVLALVPASISQFDRKSLSFNITNYTVESDFTILGEKTRYTKEDPIPSFFIAAPLNDNWTTGFSIYSRTAADISLPDIGTEWFSLFHETHIKPIVLSYAPTLAFQQNNISLAITGEMLHATYQFQQSHRVINTVRQFSKEGDALGWSGKISASWTPMPSLYLAASHQLPSKFGNDTLQFDLPPITSLYVAYAIFPRLWSYASLSHSQWKEKGIKIRDYSDPFGLLKNSSDTLRVGFGLSYELNKLQLKVGFSESTFTHQGGERNQRYRIGLDYALSSQWRLNIAYFKGKYDNKTYSHNDYKLVNVSNNENAINIGMNYSF